MPTRAAFAATLLREAASLFRAIGAENPGMTAQLDESARCYELAAEWLLENPSTEIPVAIASRTDDEA